ncbi:DUF454 family protein [Erwinia sp. CPCC 100877]|nr:DUF454 family protein [Erwinia sp. CPCC 100877]
MKKGLFILCGSLTLVLGTIGIFLPFLPTTVFYLLTGFFWLRSSEKLYQKFIQSAHYQKYVQEALLNRKMTTNGMLRMFLVMLVIFLIPGLLVNNLIMRLSLMVVYLAHVIGLTWYLKGKDKATKQETTLGEADD